MARCVALLRGINLGSRNKIAMGDLRAAFEALGAQDVQTYVQSGNVVFDPGAGTRPTAAALEERVAQDVGVRAPVLLRSAAELAEIVAENPFLARGADPAALHVTFLAEAPAAELVEALDPQVGAPDELAVRSREVYVHCPGGYGRTKLTNAFLERRLRVVATTRNWRTVTALRDLADG
jgi:uncharacterized protein (DUF1697 family)